MQNQLRQNNSVLNTNIHGSMVKKMPVMQETQETPVHPWVRKIPWRRAWLPIPGFLPEKSHGQRSLAGYSPWGHKELDTTEAAEHDIHKQQSIRKCYQNRDHKNIP